MRVRARQCRSDFSQSRHQTQNGALGSDVDQNLRGSGRYARSGSYALRSVARMPGRLALGQIQRVEIGPAAQHGLIGILRDHRLGAVIDDLIDDRSRGLIDERLMRDEIARRLRIVTHGHAGVHRRDTLARGQFGRDRVAGRVALRLYNSRSSRRPHRPDAEIRTHGSLLASLESNPNPPSGATMA